MNDLHQWAEQILLGPSLNHKLLTPSPEELKQFWLELNQSLSLQKRKQAEFMVPDSPGRNEKLKISDQQIKFPRSKSLGVPSQRALAMHFFANHELLAIEMCASALLLYPVLTKEDVKFKWGVVSTLLDEQRHFKLYLERIEHLGVGFGDYPLNGFFWSKMSSLKTKEMYLSVMAMTFESANLDFALFYRDQFKLYGDDESAQIMQQVYDDEINHVAFGHKILTQSHLNENLVAVDQLKQKSFWQYYCQQLPFPLTPARSKGIIFDQAGRKKAGLSSSFIEEVKSYQDPFLITNRKRVESSLIA